MANGQGAKYTPGQTWEDYWNQNKDKYAYHGGGDLFGGTRYDEHQARSHYDAYSSQNSINDRYTKLSDQIDKATNPDWIKNLFNQGTQNLFRAQGQAVGNTGRMAAAQAGGAGFLNPSAFITAMTSNARAPFAAQYGQLQEKQAGALQQNELTKFNLMQLLDRAKAGDEQAAKELQLAYDQLNFQKQQYQDSQPTIADYLLKLAPSLVNLYLGK